MNGKFFQCSCYQDGILVQHDEGWGTEFAFYSSNPNERSWKNRLKLAWACLKGKPYSDMVILDDQALADLVDHLVEIQNRNY
jgi:hypothetical protein